MQRSCYSCGDSQENKVTQGIGYGLQDTCINVQLDREVRQGRVTGAEHSPGNLAFGSKSYIGSRMLSSGNGYHRRGYFSPIPKCQDRVVSDRQISDAVDAIRIGNGRDRLLQGVAQNLKEHARRTAINLTNSSAQRTSITKHNILPRDRCTSLKTARSYRRLQPQRQISRL